MKKFLSLILVAIMLVTATPMAFAEGNTYEVGDIVQFGSYPQSEVKDETLIAELNALAPEWDDWTSYGYYSGNGDFGSMVQGDWMRYVDIELDGEKYRGVKFTQYNVGATTNSHIDSVYEYQAENGYVTNNFYWFKFESINWRILDPFEGLVITEDIVDVQAYNNTIYYNNGIDVHDYAFFNDILFENYACDYEISSIRRWLNNDFYNTAFTDDEKNKINTSSLNNDGYYTSVGTVGYERLDSNKTEDKIFLLSYNEVINNDYGFSSVASDYDIVRKAKGSDYAKSQGLYVPRFYDGYSGWILRSAGKITMFCSNVVASGNVSGSQYGVHGTYYGIRPALRFNLDSEIVKPEHSCLYNAVVTSPTCTTQGYTTYTCDCGDTYVGDYVDIVPHIDADSDYKCDYGCGYEFEQPEVKLNFFQTIIQWFKNLFAKLFGWMK